MGGEFKKCACFAKEIRVEAVICRCSNRELQQPSPQSSSPPTHSRVLLDALNGGTIDATGA